MELLSSVSLDPLTEGASAHLPVPRSLDRVLATSWFRGHEVQPEAMIFSPEGLPGPGHTGRETLDTQGSLIIRNVTTLDAGSYMVVLETSRGRRSATEQIPIKGNFTPPPLPPWQGGRDRVLSPQGPRGPILNPSSVPNIPELRRATSFFLALDSCQQLWSQLILARLTLVSAVSRFGRIA